MRISMGLLGVGDTGPITITSAPAVSNRTFSSNAIVLPNAITTPGTPVAATMGPTDFAQTKKQALQFLSDNKIDSSQCSNFIATMIGPVPASQDNNFKAALCMVAYPDSDSCSKYDVFLQKNLGDPKYTWEAGYGNPGIAAACKTVSTGPNWAMIGLIGAGLLLLFWGLR